VYDEAEWHKSVTLPLGLIPLFGLVMLIGLFYFLILISFLVFDPVW